MHNHDFTNKKVALLGYGVENRAVVGYLQGKGAQLTICDQNEALVVEGIDTRLGPNYLENLTDFDVLVRTPGIPITHRSIQTAKAAGVLVTSQTQLFLEACPARVIGVTGTKGKGTTSSLIAAAFTAAGQNYFLGGNIGTPLMEQLDQIKPEDWVILELSSFQLHDVTISPHIAVVLAITIDHMDYHRDEAEYISAKKNIVRFQRPTDYCIVNLDSWTSIHFADETLAQTYFYSRHKPVDLGAFVHEESVILRLPDQADKVLFSTQDVKLAGAYNLENVTAAVTACALAGLSDEAITTGMTHFTGLSHRLELVAEKHNVKYYDDSKATTPDSTIAAIQAFTEPTVLIVGGSPKGADYTELVEVINASQITSVVCIGVEGERIKALLEESGTEKTVLDGGATMSEIVATAAHEARPGSVVVLSPAAASFDMFKGAEDRGNQFKDAVNQL